MSAGWVAGSTRARLLLERRVGAGEARSLARARDLEDALARLAGTAYSAAATASPTLEDAQRAVASVFLLELRLLLGWLPRGSSELVRSLGAWFELVNVEDRLAYLRGSPLLPAYELGALASAWPRAAGAASPAELREALRASVWADPGGDDEATIHLGLRLAWARRIEARVPEARAWVGGALALVAARGVVTGSRALREVPLDGAARPRRRVAARGDPRRAPPEPSSSRRLGPRRCRRRRAAVGARGGLVAARRQRRGGARTHVARGAGGRDRLRGPPRARRDAGGRGARSGCGGERAGTGGRRCPPLSSRCPSG